MAVRKIVALVVCLWSAGVSGCSLLHDLQPHRLRRLNRVPPPHLDPEFTQRRPQRADSMIVRAQNEEAQGWRSLGFRAGVSVDR